MMILRQSNRGVIQQSRQTEWIRRLALGAAFAFGIAGNAPAALIVSPASISSPTVIDFSQFTGTGLNFQFGPTQVGGLVGRDVVFTADPAGGGVSGLGSILGQGGYALISNGIWTTGPGGNAYTGLDANVGSMTYTFNDGLVSGVGGFVNYIPDTGFGPTLIEALAADRMTVLESYVLNTDAPISTPGGQDDGAFRGILRASADIGAFRVSGGFVVLDDLTFGAASQVEVIPEPSTLTLMGLGGLILVGVRYRRNRSRQAAA